MDGVIVDRGDKNNGNFRADRFQPPPKLDTGHAVQMNVENKTIRVLRGAAVKKFFGGSKALGGKTARGQQPLNRFQHCLLVVDNGNYFALIRHE
jgi:hypothetical protein